MQSMTSLQLELELRRARKKFPNNDRLFLSLAEEVGELAKATLERGNVQEEALHVACVAIRIYEEGYAEHGATNPRPEVSDGLQPVNNEQLVSELYPRWNN